MMRVSELIKSAAVLIGFFALATPGRAAAQIPDPCAPAPRIVMDGRIQPAGPGMSRPCVPGSPDFVSDDTRQLLTGIKVTTQQNAALKKLAKAYGDRQKKIVEERKVAIAREAQSNRQGFPPASNESAVRALYLTTPMRDLRNALATEIRRVLSAGQVDQFETNLAALKLRDAIWSVASCCESWCHWRPPSRATALPH
jgi:hypothetical protein